MALIEDCNVPGSNCFIIAKQMNNTATIHITHYQRVVAALNETICLMADIDRVIDTHGGWPGAFQSGSQKESGV